MSALERIERLEKRVALLRQLERCRYGWQLDIVLDEIKELSGEHKEPSYGVPAISPDANFR